MDRSFNYSGPVQVFSGYRACPKLIALLLDVIQVHEWLGLLGDEYELIISARRNFAKCLYLGCRYYPLVTWPIIMWCFLADHNPDTCGNITCLLYVLFIPYPLLSQLVMVLRSWAFTGRRISVAAGLGSLYIALAATEIWVFVSNVRETKSQALDTYVNGAGCFRGGGKNDLKVATRTAILFVLACGVDLSCMIATWLHCLNIRSTQGSLGRIFLVQGFSAFLLLAAVHLGSAIMSISHNTSLFSGGFLLPVPLVLCNIVVCRMILYVRRRNSPTESQISYRISNIVRNDLAYIDDFTVMSETSTLV
ncbi:hypothetical protein APHAL10511_004540 [Amanita phalloides]|nr:hypothetical protein APHAL10511_004540 [Amanita phalloides]